MSHSSPNGIPCRPMDQRRYAPVKIDEIVVVNTRERDQEQFDDNVRNIDSVGLLKPIVVNERHRKKSGKFELVCGEGRLLAHKRLGKTTIQAEIVDVDRKQAHLIGLIENMARVPPGTMWFAREIVRMKNAGMSIAEIAQIQGRSDCYVKSYIRLAEEGEDRLIKGVEQGLFPIAFAHRVVEAGDAHIQSVLMDAFDANIVNAANFTQVKRIIDARIVRRATKTCPGAQNHTNYSVDQLRRDISRVTREKQSYVKEAEHKENRLFAVVGALETLMNCIGYADLLKSEGLELRPALSGAYGGLETGATEKS